MTGPPALARILRHYRENQSKCTLQPLLGDPRFEFRTWRPGSRHQAGGFTLLALEAEELTAGDQDRPLLLLDSTWRYLAAMRDSLDGRFVPRSLPQRLATAYPRTAKLGPNPASGLASIEALYAALRIIGRRDDALLDRYHWRQEFLRLCEAAGL